MLDRDRNRESFIDVNTFDISKTPRKQLDEEVGATGGADAEGGAAEPL